MTSRSIGISIQYACTRVLSHRLPKLWERIVYSAPARLAISEWDETDERRKATSVVDTSRVFVRSTFSVLPHPSCTSVVNALLLLDDDMWRGHTINSSEFRVED